MQGLSVVPLSLQKKFVRPMTGRRAYSTEADAALASSSLGQRKTFGMHKLLGRGFVNPLTGKLPDRPDDGTGADDEEDNQPKDEGFEPLVLWVCPAEGGECRGLPPSTSTAQQWDDNGIESSVTKVVPAPETSYAARNVEVPAVLCKFLRPHQREGVQFMYECVMGQRAFSGKGCILADDMGLGKTLQSVALIYTMLKSGITADGLPTCKKVIIVCPCSLVKNWDNEFSKWLGAGTVKTMALAENDRKTVEKNIDSFVKTNIHNVLIVSYETLRTHVERLNKDPRSACDLLVCDEAHRLKNADNQTSGALSSIKCRRRVLLTGTPMQNDLEEFFAIVDFTNPNVLGSAEDFRRKFRSPILRGKEPDATAAQRAKMLGKQQEMSNIVNEFILRRVNTLNAQHLPPKLVQVVCCRLTDMQENIYNHLIGSKAIQQITDGKQVNCLSSIQMLMKLCNHPRLVAEDELAEKAKIAARNAAALRPNYDEDDRRREKGQQHGASSAAPGADGVNKFLPFVPGRRENQPVFPEWSGKMNVLFRLMKEMRKPGNGNDKIVVISNYTQTLDLIGKMCAENNWKSCRLDGSVTMKKRQKLVDEFNDPCSTLVAFLLSSKAGGCGLNLIGANRLVLFDPDWNPAVDKQAAARCWRDGQRKRCFTYRFLATGSVEEKIYQRQLSKEGLQSIVDDKEQVNALSSKDLKNLFQYRGTTPSDTHDKLNCTRCKLVMDDAAENEKQLLPSKLLKCKELLNEMVEHEDAERFLNPADPDAEGITREEYDRIVKQPMDLGRIQAQLDKLDDKTKLPYYKTVAEFSKDVNRIFSNVAKVWDQETDIGLAAGKLQKWWLDRWQELVPILMTMKVSDAATRPSCEGAAASAAAKQQQQQASAASKAAGGGDEDGDFYEAIVAPVVVERSEDYQEQIGMPDEQDMRDWSHHFSTDTVDDPIFRAAMKGTDCVSFVFGLEVTWDLIQARKQEEEETAALDELRKLEEQQAARADASDSDDDGKENAIVVCNNSKKGGKAAVDKANKQGQQQGKKVPGAGGGKKRDDVSSDEDEDAPDNGSDLEGFIVDGDEDGDNDDGNGSDEFEEVKKVKKVKKAEKAETVVEKTKKEKRKKEEKKKKKKKKEEAEVAVALEDEDDDDEDKGMDVDEEPPKADDSKSMSEEEEEEEDEDSVVTGVSTTHAGSDSDDFESARKPAAVAKAVKEVVAKKKPAKEKKEPAATSNARGMWDCSACTFVNTKSAAKKCEMCNVKRVVVGGGGGGGGGGKERKRKSL